MQTSPLLALLMLLFAMTASGEEKLAQGGRSPDGQYELRISGAENGYHLYLYRPHSTKPLYSLPPMGGYLNFETALERNHGLWHPSSRFLALSDQATRHSREVYLLHVDGEQAHLLETPDFVQNALGRVGALETDAVQVITPVRWEGDDLHLKLEFTANGRNAYTFAVRLHLLHGPNSAPVFRLKSVERLRDERDEKEPN